jgi:hypothetical protein
MSNTLHHLDRNPGKPARQPIIDPGTDLTRDPIQGPGAQEDDTSPGADRRGNSAPSSRWLDRGKSIDCRGPGDAFRRGFVRMWSGVRRPARKT